MTPEELMMPRYKVIADWPKSIHPIGTIYNCGGTSEDLLYCDNKGPRMRDYPHLFKKLEWWEDRKPEEMPEYIKYWDTSLYFPVDRVCKGSEAPFTDTWTSDNFQPATEQEYLEYIKQKEEQQ